VFLDGTLLDQARLAGQYVWGDYLNDPNVRYRRVRAIRISCAQDARFFADGDPLPGRAVRFRIVPQGLHVLAGPGYPGGGGGRKTC
jgi:diacylglycerol kinase family enzyme